MAETPQESRDLGLRLFVRREANRAKFPPAQPEHPSEESDRG